MKIDSKRVVLLLLIAIVLLSVALRYPLVEHERFQTDSYYFHFLGASIVREGRAAWTVHPLSYFGYYPASYPSGVPFVLAETSILTGTSTELSILIADVMIGLLFLLIVFCLARVFIDSPLYALLATTFAVLAPRFLDTTYWDGSARGFAVVLMTLLVLVGVLSQRFRLSIGVAMLFLVGFACFASHHLAVLIVVYGLGFVISVVAIRFIFARRSVRGRRLAASSFVAVSVVGMFVGGILAGAYSREFDKLIGGDGFFDFGSNELSALMNLGVSYVHQVGFVLILAVFGVYSAFKSTYYSIRYILPAALLLVLTPVPGSSLYVSMLVAPFAAIVGAFWLYRASKAVRRKNVFVLFIAIFVLSSAFFSAWSVERWNSAQLATGDTVEVPIQVFNDAVYLDCVAGSDYAVGNGEALTWQLQALTDVRFLRSGVSELVNGDLTGDDIAANLTDFPMGFPWNLYVWSDYKDKHLVDFFVYALMMAGTSVARDDNARFAEYAAPHKRMFVVVDSNWPSDYASMYGPTKAAFLGEIREASTSRSPYESFPSYMVYASERSSVYIVELPS